MRISDWSSDVCSSDLICLNLSLAAAAAQPIWIIMPFSQLPPMLGEALAARGYAAPTPVQAAVLEPDAEGRDLIVSAQTGSAKTFAFRLAMAPQLLEPNDGLPFILEPLPLIIATTHHTRPTFIHPP